MAAKGGSKALSVDHELWVANYYGGLRSFSSGAAQHDQGDVRVVDDARLIECKFKGSPAKPLKKKPTLLSQMEKIADEAWSEGKDPMICLRYYSPDSSLANAHGWVDLVVRRVADDPRNRSFRPKRQGE